MGVILIVGHGSTLDSCTRPLLRLPPQDCRDLAQLVRKVHAPIFLWDTETGCLQVLMLPSESENKYVANPGHQGPAYSLRWAHLPFCKGQAWAGADRRGLPSLSSLGQLWLLVSKMI